MGVVWTMQLPRVSRYAVRSNTGVISRGMVPATQHKLTESELPGPVP
jgi:hypothetical protein